jgi:hypothetical protein
MIKKNAEDVAVVLNCYKIKFEEKRKGRHLTIKEAFGTEDFITLCQEFVKKFDKTFFRNKKQDRIIYLKEILKASETTNVFSGIVMKGHNGPETLIDELVKNEVKTVSRVTKDQFHCLPYFFLLYMNNKNPSSIIFIAQSYRQFGFKEVFEEVFRSFVKDNSIIENKIEFNTLSIATLFEKHINDGKLYKLRFIKHGLSKNAEGILMGDKIEDKNNYEMEISIKSNKGFFGIKPKLKYDDASFIEQIQLENFNFEEVYADIIIGGRKRAINVSKPKEFAAAYDITNEVTIDPSTKLPNFEEVLKEAEDILNNDLIPFV